MKKTFGREIEEETAKLESYRQLKAPARRDAQPPSLARTPTGSRPPTAAADADGRASRGRRRAGQAPSRRRRRRPRLAADAGRRATPARRTAPRQAGRRSSDDSSALAWDDDELETQIYDNPEDEAAERAAGVAAKPKPVRSQPSRRCAVAAGIAARPSPLAGIAPSRLESARVPICRRSCRRRRAGTVPKPPRRRRSNGSSARAAVDARDRLVEGHRRAAPRRSRSARRARRELRGTPPSRLAMPTPRRGCRRPSRCSIRWRRSARACSRRKRPDEGQRHALHRDRWRRRRGRRRRRRHRDDRRRARSTPTSRPPRRPRPPTPPRRADGRRRSEHRLRSLRAARRAR